MKFFKKQKGQGALEYLLLIGGAVLIAVIVIALIVGMGGQSRKSAQDQGESAKKAMDIPQPSYISHLTPIKCYKNGRHAQSEIKFSWNLVGAGGSHRLYIKNSQNELVRYTIEPVDETEWINGNNPNPHDELPNVSGIVYYNWTNVSPVDPLNKKEGYELPYDEPTVTVFVNLSNGEQTAETECGDTYYAYIETTKNNQTVTSGLERFHW